MLCLNAVVGHGSNSVAARVRDHSHTLALEFLQEWQAQLAPRELEEDEVADRDWMQLAWILRYQLPDLFIEMLMVLRAKASAFDAGFGDEQEVEEDDGKVETGDTDRGKATPAKRDSDEESAI